MENHETKRLAVGIAVGALIGAAALHLFRTAQKPTVVKRVGKTISDFGHLLENCDFGPADLTEQIEEMLPSKKEVKGSFLDFVDFGMKIWKKFK